MKRVQCPISISWLTLSSVFFRRVSFYNSELEICCSSFNEGVARRFQQGRCEMEADELFSCCGRHRRGGRSVSAVGRPAGHGARVPGVVPHHLRRVRPAAEETLLHQRGRTEAALRRRRARPLRQQHAPHQGRIFTLDSTCFTFFFLIQLVSNKNGWDLPKKKNRFGKMCLVIPCVRHILTGPTRRVSSFFFVQSDRFTEFINSVPVLFVSFGGRWATSGPREWSERSKTVPAVDGRCSLFRFVLSAAGASALEKPKRKGKKNSR